MKQFLQKLVKGYNAVESLFVIGFTFFIGIMTIYTIVVRAFGGQSFRWIDELGRIMLITTTLTAGSIAFKNDEHMAVDSLYCLVGKKKTLILKAFTRSLSGCFYLWLSIFALKFTMIQYSLNRTMESVNFPVWVVWATVCVSLISMGIRNGVNAFSYIRQYSAKNAKSSDETEMIR